MNKETYRILIEAECDMGILNRILHIFSRRRIPFSTLRMDPLKNNLQQITIVINEPATIVEKLLPQIEKQIAVLNASYSIV